MFIHPDNIIKKTVQVPITCDCGHEHTHEMEVMDYGAYWWLDATDEPTTDPAQISAMYAKVAYPREIDAVRHAQESRAFVHAKHQATARRPRRKKVTNGSQA